MAQFICKSRGSVYEVHVFIACLRSMKDQQGAITGTTAAGVLKKVDYIKFLAVL